MIISFIFVLMPSLLNARMKIDITVGKTKDDILVKLSGESNDDLVTSTELTTFLLNEDTLKDAISNSTNTMPERIALKELRPWGDYDGKSPVTRIVTPMRSSILSFQAEDKIIARETINNYETETKDFNFTIHEDIEDTVLPTWTNANQINISEEIDYIVRNVKPNQTPDYFNFTSRWGNLSPKSTWGIDAEPKIFDLNIATDHQVPVSIDAHDKVNVETHATKYTVHILVEYDTTLSGYIKTFGSEPDITYVYVPTLLKDAGLTSIVVTKEVIEIQYYLEPRAEVNAQVVHLKKNLFTINLKLY